MSNITYEDLRKRVSDELNAGIRDFGKTVVEIDRHFRYLGLEKSVWHPERVYAANIGGLEAESYIGYSRLEGKWGLMIRTIERDLETRAFVSQRVFPIGSCGNMEIVVNALHKIPELFNSIRAAVDRQLKSLGESREDFEVYRSPDFTF
jgi:hypothetical protein